MAKTSQADKRKRRRIIFNLEAANAEEVILMGDFNNWDPKKHPMKKDEKGVWKKILMLYPGRFEYKFLVDDRWQIDPKNKKVCPNCYGTLNSVIVVESK